MFGWRPKPEAPRPKADAVARLRRGTTTEAVLPLTLPRSNDAWLPAQLQPVHRRGAEPDACGEPSTSGQEVLELRWPLRLGFSAVAGGRPDLQLRVLEFSCGVRDLRPPPFIQHAGPQGLAEGAAALLFLRLVFPEQCPTLERGLACVGLAAAARPALAAAERRCRLGQRLPRLQLGTRLRLGSPAAVAQRWQARARAAQRRAAALAQAAALLAAAAALWCLVHPRSLQLAQAVAVAFQLSCGYAHTSRQAASGRIPPGPRLEAAWRARHKWAAQKAAPVLGEACESPPLRPLLTAAQRLSLQLALLTAQLPGSLPSAAPSPACGSAAAASAWCLAASYPVGRRLQEAEPQEQAAAAASGQLSTSAMPAVESGREPAAAAAVAAARPPQSAPGQAAAPAAPLPAHFVPSEAEAMFPTSSLPTVTSFQELAASQAAAPRVAVTADATHTAQQQAGPASPEQQQQQGPEQAEASQALVPFSTEELLKLDPAMAARRPWGPADEGGMFAGLPLFGRADHAPPPRLGLRELQQMTLRALYLQLLFLPFALLAPLLLLLARLSPQPAAAAGAPAEAGWARATAWRLLLFCVRRSGPAAIKWAQWSSSREDMFPRDLCAALGQLTDAAPTHAWRDSRRQITAAFGRPPEQLFESIEPRPLASGSIAQVHRAVMLVGGKRRDVAVKVRHPGVDARIRQDFRLLQPFAAAASQVPALRGLSLKESLAQFSSTMTAQTDLRVEAAHLLRFCRNFAPMRQAVTPPFPLPGLISEAVLVETFEPGQSVARFIRQPAPFNTEIVALGVDTYLKMLLTDNFVHTDLHPGNILVRRRDGGPLQPGTAAEAVRGGLQLVLLDFGLAEELTPAVRRHFISFLHMIARGDGLRAAHHILCWSKNQTCPNPAAFSLAMQQLFTERCDIRAPGGIELDAVMKAVLREARRFQVAIDSGYAALVVGVAIIVGFATSLDPRVNLMDAAAPAFLQNALLGRVTGRLYS